MLNVVKVMCCWTWLFNCCCRIVNKENMLCDVELGYSMVAVAFSKFKDVLFRWTWLFNYFYWKVNIENMLNVVKVMCCWTW